MQGQLGPPILIGQARKFLYINSTPFFVYGSLKATLHLEAGPIRCERGLKSSLVIGQKVEIGPNSFTPRGRADLVV
jgi:hypothetical protein